jgi:histidine triad (HIT) family protein
MRRHTETTREVAFRHPRSPPDFDHGSWTTGSSDNLYGGIHQQVRNMTLCPFCKIIGGESDRPVLYENDSMIAFMPLRPSHDGHVLVMPKAHYEDFYGIPDEELSQLFTAAREIAKTLKLLFDSPKIATYSMGLEVVHAHLHLIPVFDPYDLTTRSEFEHSTKEKSRIEIERLSNFIKSAVRTR